MAVDRRLLTYFSNAKLFNTTGEDIWLEMLRDHSRLGTAPGNMASKALVDRYDKEDKVIGSG